MASLDHLRPPTSFWRIEIEIKATSNDLVIFTSLKPMSDVNLSIPVMFYDANRQPYLGIFFDADHVVIDGVVLRSVQFIGWHHAPKFKPEWIEQ